MTLTRHNRNNRVAPARLSPIIISTPSSEMRAEVTNLENRILKLVGDLKSPSVEAVRHATSELRTLSKDTDNTILISTFGAIPPLVNLLHSSDQTTQENAVTALLNLSISDNNKTDIAKSDAVDHLIHVLRTGSPTAKANSAATLFSLSKFEDANVLIGNSGAIPPLVDLLSNGTPQGKKDAATALFNLSTCGNNRQDIVRSGAVRVFLGLMVDPGIGVVDRAVSVLANVASIPEGRAAIVQEEDGIFLLVEALELGSVTVKKCAAQALVCLCSHSSRCCRKVLEEGAIPPLVLMSRSGIPKVTEKADKLLALLRNQKQVFAKRG